jgi:hypothetical protein
MTDDDRLPASAQPCRRGVLVVVAGAAAVFASSPVSACMQQSDELYTFTRTAPPRPTDDTVRLLVRIKGKSNGEYLADLLPPFHTLPGVTEVRISDPSTPSDCSRTGPEDGPAWVVGRVRGVLDGVLYFSAIQRHSKLFVIPPNGADRWRSYIVDPKLKKLAENR